MSNKHENSYRLASLTHQLYPQIVHRSMLVLKVTERKQLNLEAK